jgi:8-oxo-dGTP pyrophosphatase MutT (NUDIX family)
MRAPDCLDEHLPATLQRRLAAAASAAAAPYRRFAPQLSYGRHRGPAAADARPAAVVALLYPAGGQWHLPLILRPDSMILHAGQICLPGGGAEPGETAGHCALRELHEELGVAPESVRVLGALPPLYVYASNYLVRPFVAHTPQQPVFRPDRCEVAQLLQVPLAHLLDAGNYRTPTISRGWLSFAAPGIAFQGYHIWGATALILNELLERVRGGAGEG